MVHPAAKATGDEGKRVVDQRLAEEHEAKKMLSELEKIGPEGAGFDERWNRFKVAVLAHAEAEEHQLFPILEREKDQKNLQRMTDQGYAVSPNWAPNGQFLTFAWVRKYGPGAPGASDVYLMDIASKQWVQLTHDGGRNDFPSWSPDGRHLIFQSNRSGSLQIWTMLADGTKQTQLTSQGTNSQPNWSWK